MAGPKTSKGNMEEPAAELKKIHCDLGTLSSPDGSALFTSGETVVIAAVNGPCEVNLRKLSIDEATIEVYYRPKIGTPGILDWPMASILSRISSIAILKSQYPRTSITIIIQEMQNNGGLLACAINALCLALVNSGLSMKFLFAAVHSIIDVEGNIILDPDLKQLKGCKAEFTMTVNEDGAVISTEFQGNYNIDQFQDVVSRSKMASSKMFDFYKEVVRKYTDRISL